VFVIVEDEAAETGRALVTPFVDVKVKLEGVPGREGKVEAFGVETRDEISSASAANYIVGACIPPSPLVF
jgi:hypothetical protein